MKRILACVGLLVGLLIMTACAGQRVIVQPPQVITPPPVTCGMFVQVYNGPTEGDHKVPGALVVVADRQAVTDGAGNATIPGSFGPGIYLVSVTAAGFYPVKDRPVELCTETSPKINLTPEPPKAPPLLRLHTDGILFRTSDSKLWRWAGYSGFTLYRQFLDGKDIQPFLAKAKELGANLVRVFGSFSMASLDQTTWLDPRVYGERYWDQISPFLTLVASQGLYVEWVALCDQQCAPGRLCVPLSESRGWVTRLAPILAAHTNVTLEISNEPDFNGVDTADFMDIGNAPGLLTASGNYNYGYDGPVLANVRQYVTDHSERGPEWPRKAKDALRELGVEGYVGNPPLRKPIVEDEPMGAGEVDRSGARSTICSDFRDYARVCALFGPGCTFHFDAGLYALLPGPIQAQCARGFFQGLSDIPLGVALLTYTAGHLESRPIEHSDAWALRTFCMMSTTEATCVIVRRNQNHQLITRQGWSVKLTTSDGSVVYLVK